MDFSLDDIDATRKSRTRKMQEKEKKKVKEGWNDERKK